MPWVGPQSGALEAPLSISQYLYCIRASNRRETPALARVRESGRPSPVRARSCGSSSSSSSTITTTTTWAMAMADDGPSALFQTCASFSWPWQPSFFRIARLQHAHVEPHPVELHKRPARRRPNPLALRCELRGMQCRAVATSVQRPASSIQHPATSQRPRPRATLPARKPCLPSSIGEAICHGHVHWYWLRGHGKTCVPISGNPPR
jgi:hypothetical protein